MGFLATIFGSKKAVDDAGEIAKTVSTGVVSGIDKMFYTDEEKEDNAQMRMKLASDLILKLQDQFTPRAITRRVLAVIIVATFDLVFLVSVVLAILDKTNAVDKIIGIVNAFQFGTLVITIIIFYFGYYGIGKIIDKKNGK